MNLTTENVSKTHIYLAIDRSVAELDRADHLADEYELMPPVFWFARIKADPEGLGRGTALMKKVCEHADALEATIVNAINPYGRMNLEELQEWFQKFGFELIHKGLVIRKPQNGEG